MLYGNIENMFSTKCVDVYKRQVYNRHIIQHIANCVGISISKEQIRDIKKTYYHTIGILSNLFAPSITETHRRVQTRKRMLWTASEMLLWRLWHETKLGCINTTQKENGKAWNTSSLIHCNPQNSKSNIQKTFFTNI